MNDYFLFFGVLAIFFLIISEFVGRSKHIGRWWSFALLLSGFIPGIIAIIASPSARKNPTTGGKNYEIWAWILIAFGILNFVVTIIGMQKGEEPNPVSIIFFISGIYIYRLSRGSIINGNPRFYFQKSYRNNVLSQSNEIVKSTPNTSSFEEQKMHLLNLKNKGILTNEEYVEKISLLDNSILNYKMRATEEYHALYSLNKSGILNNEEFNKKAEELATKLRADIINSPEVKINNKSNQVKHKHKKPLFDNSTLSFLLITFGVIGICIMIFPAYNIIDSIVTFTMLVGFYIILTSVIKNKKAKFSNRTNHLSDVNPDETHST